MLVYIYYRRGIIIPEYHISACMRERQRCEGIIIPECHISACMRERQRCRGIITLAISLKPTSIGNNNIQHKGGRGGGEGGGGIIIYTI
jgi:hypothetical protein